MTYMCAWYLQVNGKRVNNRNLSNKKRKLWSSLIVVTSEGLFTDMAKEVTPKTSYIKKSITKKHLSVIMNLTLLEGLKK